MANPEQKTWLERGAEWSKRLDIIFIGIGGVIYIFKQAVGAAIIIGSVLTIIPAQEIQRWARKRQARAAQASYVKIKA